jgi:hypothetical protein
MNESSAVAELARVMAALQDPLQVHLALLRGEIARPDIRAVLHAYGAEALERWDRAAPSGTASDAAKSSEQRPETQHEGTAE